MTQSGLHSPDLGEAGTGRLSRRLPAAFLASGTVLMLVGLLSFANGRVAERLAHAPPVAELVYAPPSRFLQVVSLGYRHVLGDVLWFRAINYFGEHYKGDRIYPWLYHMCDRVTDLNPRARYVYRFGGLILPWEAELVDEGIALLQKGVRNLPESWEMPYLLGFTYYFFKNDLDAASQALRRAIATPNAPAFLSDLLAVIDATHHGPQNAVAFLQAAARNIATPEVREALHERIRELWLTSDVLELQAAVDRFRMDHGHNPADLLDLFLSGYMAYIPHEPFGGRYLLDTTSGRVYSSSGRQPRRLGSSPVREAIRQEQRQGSGE